MPVNWGMGITPDVAGNALAAFRQGQAERKQADAQKAMTSYVTNPNDQTLNALAPYQPDYVLQQRQAMQAQQQKQAEQRLVGDALAHPDPAIRTQARQQLAYTNSELYMKLGDQQKAHVDNTMKAIAQQAFHIMQLPKEQQEGALQQALDGLKAQGIDTSSFHLTGNPDVDLRSALAITGQLDDFEKFAEPKYVPVGEGGLSGFQFGKPIQQGGQTQNFAPSAQPNIPNGAIDELRKNPGTAAQFDEIFGAGSASRILGGGSGNATGGFHPVGISGERITSTMRSASHNRAVGGVPNSYHLRGMARDSVPPPGMSMAEYHRRLKALNPNLDVINKGDHVHMEPR